MIDIVINEPLINHVDEYDAILVATNCYQSMRNGFQYDCVKKYPYIEETNYKTRYADKSKLGEVLECKEEGKPLFLLTFLTFGYNFKGNDEDYFEYDSLVKCLKLLNILYKGKNIATTMLGCNKFDGNADKNKVLDIINQYVTCFNLTIYDYRQFRNKEIKRKEYNQYITGVYAERKRKKPKKL